KNTNAILAHLAGSVGDDFMAVLELYPECRVGQQLDNGPGKIEGFFFGHTGSVCYFARGTCCASGAIASAADRARPIAGDATRIAVFRQRAARTSRATVKAIRRTPDCPDLRQ